ncbi:MAG: hypothetical protein WBD19_12220, partial [Candidatus Acidiferrum sp.]
MSRNVPEVQQNSTSVPSHKPDPAPEDRPKRTAISRGRALEFWLVRLAITACAIALCYALEPSGLRGLPAIVLGCFL